MIRDHKLKTSRLSPADYSLTENRPKTGQSQATTETAAAQPTLQAWSRSSSEASGFSALPLALVIRLFGSLLKIVHT